MFNCQLKSDNIPAKGQEMVSRRRVLSAIPAKPLLSSHCDASSAPAPECSNLSDDGGPTIPVAGFLYREMRISLSSRDGLWQKCDFLLGAQQGGGAGFKWGGTIGRGGPAASNLEMEYVCGVLEPRPAKIKFTRCKHASIWNREREKRDK